MNAVTVRRGGHLDGFTTYRGADGVDRPADRAGERDAGIERGDMLGEVDRFAVNLLSEAQRSVAEWFATPHERRDASARLGTSISSRR
ncbi:MAG: hypothetical protein R3A48_19390 [Polyangiales bacterium]